MMVTAVSAQPRKRAGFLARRPVLRAFAQAPSGLIAVAGVVLIVLVMILAPLFVEEAATVQDLTRGNLDPSSQHLLGTDAVGRDVLARLLYAARLSIGSGIVAAGIALAVGLLIGVASAMARPSVRRVIQRGIEVSMALPNILMAVVLSVVLGAGLVGVVVGVGLSKCFTIARLSSTLSVSVRNREFISAARLAGVSPRRLMVRYVVANIAEPLIVTGSAVIASSIVAISALSFLGLGIQPPQFDWGTILTAGLQSIYFSPAIALGAAAFIAVSAVTFALAGEALARAMNPRLWTSSTGRPAAVASTVHELSGGGGDDPGVRDNPGLVDPGQVRALEVRDLEVSFPAADEDLLVVRGISFDVPQGTIVGIVGESGSGKTMTAMAIAQLMPYPGRVSGSIKLDGRDLNSMAPRELDTVLGGGLGVVFQDPMGSLNPVRRVGTQLTDGIRRHQGLSRRAARQKALAALRDVDMPAAERQLDRHPHQLSGGMAQRAMIAMAAMKDPALLIADEPTTALDVTVQAQIMSLIRKINQEFGTSVILISHDLALVSQNCDRVLVMYAGRIVEELAAASLVRAAKHPYTRALLGVAPEIGHGRDEPLLVIEGAPPALDALPNGCSFHPRCPLAVDLCREVVPPMVARADGHRVACHVANDGVDSDD